MKVFQISLTSMVLIFFSHPVFSYTVYPLSDEYIPEMQQEAYHKFLLTGDASHADLSRLDLRYAVNSLRENKGDGFRINFSYADVSRVNYAHTNLNRANFLRAQCQGACFSGCSLLKANLGEANLSKAVLKGSCLQGAILKRANLTDANFNDANLTGADFTGAIITGALFENAILDNVKGLTLEE